MKVQELIEALSKLSPDARVMLSTPDAGAFPFEVIEYTSMVDMKQTVLIRGNYES